MIYDVNGTEISTGYSINGETPLNLYDINGNIIEQDPTHREFLSTAIITPLSGTVSEDGSKQGACTDGEYIYQTSGDVTNYTYMKIIKYKISDGTSTSVEFNGTPNFGHANDMTYNPNNGYLYICTMLSDGSVVVLDSSDLSYVDTIYLKNASNNAYTVWQFCYDRLTNHVLSVTGNDILVYDQSFNYLSSIAIPEHLNATAQGCETDGIYFYRVTYNPNKIDVIKLQDGTRVKIITNPMTREPETLMNDWDGNFYINSTGTGQIFNSAQLFK